MFRETFVLWRRHPVTVTTTAGLVPSLWNLPADLALDWIGERVPTLGPGELLELVPILGAIAWACVCYGGTLSAALCIVQGRPVQWRDFVRCLPSAPTLTLATAIPVLLAFLLLFLSSMLPGALALGSAVAALAAASYLVARTALVGLIVVHERASLGDALTVSWKATHGEAVRVLGLGALFTLALVPLLLIEAALWSRAHLSFAVLGVLYALAQAQLYQWLRRRVARDPEPDADAGAANASDQDSGSGWSRPSERSGS